MILDDIVCVKNEDVKLRKDTRPLKDIVYKLERTDIKNLDFKGAINKENICIIGEVKKASPSKGIIVEDFDPAGIARKYKELDIDAISVLTEEHYFMGQDKYLKEVKEIAEKPVLRKDFIIDEYQIYESKLIGADAVLLIVRILGIKLRKFYKLASSLGLKCIVEVHNREELYSALEIEAEIIGINNRNLENFTVDLRNTGNLIKYIPDETVVISESGIKTMDDFNYIKTLPVNAVLIGEGLMRKLNDLENMKKFIGDIKNG
ncbi:indole-3-glycerol phosphate synthase [Clostridium algifaecis]|uniref:Indole-3-glycerol phosphate synthase n=1 Tax=Clostridium algifaecis TaxID=1472040 RepID=A0ABS4KP33_9CLOT|nr:indole-3-glycerol phosphate synthase TrpC [Clostridium algifaecis]MBP2031800.1 indole-3-glycerol phosphate synthase [Clostridium algifaecis]